MNNSITSNAFWNIFARIVPLAVTFFLTPIIVTRLGEGHYGLYMLVMSISGLMGIMSFGLGDATIRFVAHYSSLNDMEGVNRVFRATLFVYLAVGLVTVLAVIMLAPSIISLFEITPEEIGLATNLLRFAALGFIFNLVNTVLSAVPQALERYDINTKLVISVAMLQALVSAIFLLRGYGIIALIWIGIAAQCFSILLNYLVVRQLVPAIIVLPSFSRVGLREVFGYGMFSFLSQIFGIGFSHSDRLLAGAFISAGSVGFLTLPQDLASRGLSLVAQGGAVLFPRFSAVENLDVRTQLYLQASWAMLFLSSIIFVPATIFMPDFIGLWITPEFAAKCSYVGQLIALSSVVRGAFVVYESLYRGINKPQYVTTLSIFVGVTSLSLNFWLIPSFGIAGAGYAYCVTALFGIVTVGLTWKYVLGNSKWRPIVRTLLLPALLAYACMAFCFWLRSLYPPVGWIALVLEGGLTALITAGALIGFDVWTGGADCSAHVCINGVRRSVGLRI